jgi:hypothetical protein
MSASVLIPKFKYYPRTVTITSANDVLAFKETTGGSTLTADIPDGTYTYGELAYQIKKAMEAVGDSTYTVRYRHDTRKFYLTSDGSGGGNDFEIVYASSDIAATIGLTGDKTGALTYTMDSAVPSQTTLTFTREIARPRCVRQASIEDLVLDSGRMSRACFGASEDYAFELTHETPASAQGLYDMQEAAGEQGAVVELYPDSTSADYLEAQIVETSFEPTEMVAEGLYRHYSMTITVRVWHANAGTIGLRDLIDRLPSS